jgi:hypothetical protein
MIDAAVARHGLVACVLTTPAHVFRTSGSGRWWRPDPAASIVVLMIHPPAVPAQVVFQDEIFVFGPTSPSFPH